MTQSMTGFGSAERGPFKVEMRSLNHRFLEVSIRIPQSLIRHELPLRGMIREKFSRGRFDVFISTIDGTNTAIKVNMELASGMYEALSTVKKELSLPGEIGIETIAGFKDIIVAGDDAYDAEPLYDAFREAMDRLEEMRRGEGRAIKTDMLSRVELLRKMKDAIDSIRPDVVSACMERFRERLHSLFGNLGYDENRVLQEASLLAERIDISEEINRIASHIGQLEAVLSDGDTIGRKVEFMLQEFNREVNTIASKTDDSRISGIAVEMKAELEKMREQAQNIQ
ncbi:MAG TPA: YicC/YloC family endoribonuclease [Thermodesulfovibrionales bacterium]|nr:YicC/YloC family endoribonuclease [Thermodesulfovibrionales bacterium]